MTVLLGAARVSSYLLSASAMSDLLGLSGRDERTEYRQALSSTAWQAPCACGCVCVWGGGGGGGGLEEYVYVCVCERVCACVCTMYITAYVCSHALCVRMWLY